MKVKLLIILIVLAGILENDLIAQDKAPAKNNDDDEVIKVDTELVDVPIVVMDKAGKPILNLKPANFTVFEDGKRQEVADFAATNAPFEVAILLDTSGSTRSDLQLIRRSAENFINSLRPGDRVSIIAYKTETKDNRAVATSEVLSSLTENRADLRSALQRVGTSNGTPYYDGLLKVVEDIFRSDPKDEFRGRRALVALTDGVDSTSASDFEEAKELIEKAGIGCYFIQVNTRDFFEENLLGDCESAIRFSAAQIRRYYRRFYPNSSIEKASNFCQLGDFERLAISKKLYELADSEMKLLSKTSGGKVFPVADLSEARNAFKSVADEIGMKYSLGYYSTNEKRDGQYRKIRVELKGLPAGVQVRAREGYTAPDN
ncbi:MAG: VWA domain-containing protein [Saprospiraceae bacterium]|nr:VWA domain-containing protein [Pyrinomonadaceae bacterium]